MRTMRRLSQFNRDLLVPPQTLCSIDFVEICGAGGILSRAVLNVGLVVAPVLDMTYSQHSDFGDLRFFELLLRMWFPLAFGVSSLSLHARRFLQRHILVSEAMLNLWDLSVAMQKPAMEMSWRSGPCNPGGLEQPRRSKMAWLASMASYARDLASRKPSGFLSIRIITPKRISLLGLPRGECRWNGWGRHMSRSKAVSQSHQLPMSKDWVSTLL